MSYDLRREPWIPWRRRSGVVDWGPPAALVSRLDDDPVVAIAAPRPDFDGALQEFLIGLLSAALQPADEKAWRALWTEPPSVEALQTALDALPDAFDLDGDGPRLFQDLSTIDFATCDPKPIDQLLIDSPGDQGISLNKDLFVKRARVERMSRPVAAMALVTLQTYAPSGGQGHRTSMRGGGPLTTLIDPRGDGPDGMRAEDQPLWLALWANVETRAQLAERAIAGGDSPGGVFPWLATTRTSDLKKGGVSTTPADGHPLQVYFGIPRRIRLAFGECGRCDMTDRDDDRTVSGFSTINYGVKYDRWIHPLSPHARSKVSEPWGPLRGQPSGVAWRDWLSLTLDAPGDEGLRVPAKCVSHFANRRAAPAGRREFLVRVFGYDMDNMKARGWIQAILPAFAIEGQRRSLLYAAARSFVEATNIAAGALLFAVRTALFRNPSEARGELGQVKLELWSETESTFFDAIRALADDGLDDEQVAEHIEQVRRDFLPRLERAALAVFDRWSPTGGLDVDAIRRRVAARYGLASTLRGYSKFGEQIFAALGLAPPGGGRAARAATKSRTSKPKEKTK